MAESRGFDLHSFPPVFILSTHLQSDELHEAEDSLHLANGRLSYQASEARIFLGRVRHKKRAAFDLRANGVWTEEINLPRATPGRKRRKRSSENVHQISSDSQSSTDGCGEKSGEKRIRSPGHSEAWPNLEENVIVLRLDWLYECLEHKQVQPYRAHTIYYAKIIPKPESENLISPNRPSITYIKATPGHHASPRSPVGPAGGPQSKVSLSQSNQPSNRSQPFHRRKFGQRSPGSTHKSQIPKLHRTTTSEYEDAAYHEIPPPPSWLLQPHPEPLYSCLRSTPATNPNPHFIAQLTKIKNARLLTLDEIGVRAYSTAIASLAAYPHRITSPLEVTRLPGCDQKIATLWIEWRDSVTSSSTSQSEDEHMDAQRTIPVVQELEADKDHKILRLFHEIWGVGPDTARKFYFQHGFQDLDDLIEFHWSNLTRVQQIGVKFYDEFQIKIPRAEVEDIAKIVLKNARKARDIPEKYWSRKPIYTQRNGTEPAWPWDDPQGIHTDPRDFVAIIVGGYRRGKDESGDVDVILSHRDEKMTQDLIVDVVQSLEQEGWITHTLTLNTATSDRGGSTLPFRAQGHASHGFDSLDKALCVWQDPRFDDQNNTVTKNPNIHRRVDIIISSWKTVGCAVLGWSGGTTFQRDVRRWVKREKGWKFDSSGLRDRRDGRVLEELEGPKPKRKNKNKNKNTGGGGSNNKGKGKDDKNDGDDDDDNDDDDEEDNDIYKDEDISDGWGDRERRLMESIGIGWREASLRCTG